MSKDVIPLYVADVSAFTKTLRKSLADKDSLPGHAAMLSLVAKAAGFQNHQHLKTDTRAKAPELDELALKRALRVFDDQSLMTRWPKWTKVQGLCLWAFWAKLPAHQDMTEPQVNDLLKSGLAFDDHVLLRRSLIDHKLAERTIDGRIYRRIEQKPTPEALALLKELKSRR